MGCNLCASRKATETPHNSSKTRPPPPEKDLTQPKAQIALSPQILPSPTNLSIPDPNPVHLDHHPPPTNYPDLEDLNILPTPVLNQVPSQDPNLIQYLSNNDSIILLIGDSGSGKSSYMNLIYNFINNNTSLESLISASPTEKWPDSPDSASTPLAQFHVNSENQSFTKEIRLIQLTNPSTNKKLLFIDTPGFCRSTEAPDTATAELILSFIQQITRIDYVFYVHRSDHTKFESSLKETLSLLHPALESLSPKIIAIYTFAGSKLDVKHDSLPFPKPLVQKKYHTISNTTFDSTLTELVSSKKRKHNESLLQQSLSKLNSLLNSI